MLYNCCMKSYIIFCRRQKWVSALSFRLLMCTEHDSCRRNKLSDFSKFSLRESQPNSDFLKKTMKKASVKRGNVIHFALTLKNDTFSRGNIKLSSSVLNTLRLLLYKKGNWTIYFCEMFRADRWVQDSTISIGHESKITSPDFARFYEFKMTTSQSRQRHQKLENCKHSAFKNRVS